MFLNLHIKEITGTPVGSRQLNFLSPIKWCWMLQENRKVKCTSTKIGIVDTLHHSVLFICCTNSGGRCQSVVSGIMWLFMGRRWKFRQKVYWKLKSFVSCKCRELPKDILGTSLITIIDNAELGGGLDNKELHFEERCKKSQRENTKGPVFVSPWKPQIFVLCPF